MPGMVWVEKLALALSVFFLLSSSGAQPTTDTIRYDSLEVYSEIFERFSTTRVTSVLSNLGNESKEIVFNFQLPEEGAFISKLTMRVGGQEYYGVAKEKAVAREEYENRVNSGENVGLVESRGKELFQVSLNAAPLQQASFVLEYQQLLARYQSKYRLDLNINPGRIVDSLNVTITAKESQGIVASSIKKSDEISDKQRSATEVTVEYRPSRADQLSDGISGLSKDIFFEYDIVHPTDNGVGLVITRDRYFVQFFSPAGLPTLQVSIVFVIDASGSMGGRKIEQARESLVAVLNQLHDDDHIGIVLFESTIQQWKTSLVSVREFRNEAISYARNLLAGGSTNLNDGLLRGVSLLKTASGSGRWRILVLLTDGHPTSGVTAVDSIVSNAISAVGDSGVSVNCLGFGENLDYSLLERLALNNNGVVRRIYTGTDAGEQLKGFYNQITSPILSDLVFDYSDEVEFSSQLSFPFLFAGGEIVVVGKFREDLSDVLVPVSITAYGTSSQVTFRGTVDTTTTREFPVERLVAYQRILKLLESRYLVGTNKTVLEQEALELSLRYNFVTELTSLVVVQAGNSSNDSRLVDNNGDGSAVFNPIPPRVQNMYPAYCCDTAAASMSYSFVVIIAVPLVAFVLVVIVIIVVVVICCVMCKKRRVTKSALPVTVDNACFAALDEKVDLSKENQA